MNKFTGYFPHKMTKGVRSNKRPDPFTESLFFLNSANKIILLIIFRSI